MNMRIAMCLFAAVLTCLGLIIYLSGNGYYGGLSTGLGVGIVLGIALPSKEVSK